MVHLATVAMLREIHKHMLETYECLPSVECRVLWAQFAAKLESPESVVWKHCTFGKRPRSAIDGTNLLWKKSQVIKHVVSLHIASQKKSNFAIRHFQKKLQFNHRPFISGYICPGTPSLPYRPQILRGVRICMHSVPGSGPGTES